MNVENPYNSNIIDRYNNKAFISNICDFHKGIQHGINVSKPEYAIGYAWVYSASNLFGKSTIAKTIDEIIYEYDDPDTKFDIEYYTEHQSRMNICLNMFTRSCINISGIDLFNSIYGDDDEWSDW